MPKRQKGQWLSTCLYQKLQLCSLVPSGICSKTTVNHHNAAHSLVTIQWYMCRCLRRTLTWFWWFQMQTVPVYSVDSILCRKLRVVLAWSFSFLAIVDILVRVAWLCMNNIKVLLNHVSSAMPQIDLKSYSLCWHLETWLIRRQTSARYQNKQPNFRASLCSVAIEIRWLPWLGGMQIHTFHPIRSLGKLALLNVTKKGG
jgi:hypothetical protein